MRWRWLVLLLLLPIECAAGEFRTTDVEGLRITIDSDWGQRTAPGYLPVRFDITNLREARVIEIVSEGSRFSRVSFAGVVGISVRQALRLARGDRVRLTIPVPVFADSENIRFEIQEDGRTVERFSYTGFQSGMSPADAAALVVADPASPFGKAASGLLRLASTTTSVTAGAPSGGATPALDFLLEPGRLPANWLGYTSLRAVVIGPDEWSALDEAQRGALLTWTAAGGDLIVADGGVTALSGGGHRAPDAPSSGAARAYFFGRIHRPSAAAIVQRGLGVFLSDAASMQDANYGLPVNRMRAWGIGGVRGFRLPIPGITGIPARAYLSILILFSLLIGPVNYWILQRRQRLVLFVLTAPLVSAVFILVLAGYVVAGEGFHVSGRAATFTVLDQVSKQAATHGTATLYAAGMTPGGGLRFPRDAAVYTLGSDGAGTRDSQALDLTETQRFESGLIQARAPANIEEIGFRAARERLTITHDAGAVSVVNGLGATIDRLVFRSGGKSYSLDAPLAAGGTATLKPGGVDARQLVPGDLPMASRFVHIMESQPEGSYLAVLDRSPFWEYGVSGILERGSFHLVLGWPDGRP
jgi:hypothetical protein